MKHARHMKYLGSAVAATAMVVPALMTASVPSSVAGPGHKGGPGAIKISPTARTLPAPPAPPPGPPTQPPGYQAPTALTTTISPPAPPAPKGPGTPPPPPPGPGTAPKAPPGPGTPPPPPPGPGTQSPSKPAATTAPAQAGTWGHGDPTTLVLYDTTNTYGWLGELYAMGAGNLSTHFGTVTAEPVVNYVAGQVANYSTTVYIGSTYNEPIPTAFLNDALSDTHPLVWMSDNIWQLSGTAGSSTDQAFQSKYGWDPSTSYFDSTDNPTTVNYKGQTFTRSASNGANILGPHITNPSAVSILATANCTDSTGAATACAPIAQSGGTTLPWAIRSSNLTYVGEIPFSYMSETDRYLIYADLLFGAYSPAAAASHRALVRLEDVNPTTDPNALKQIADYLSSQNVPFSLAVIPRYLDPNGYYSGGVPQDITLQQAPQLVQALKYAQSKGGIIIEEGYTHQYSNVANPYNGVSGDDAEFYRAQCSTTNTQPYQFVSPCQNTDWVVWTGPLPGDSSSWAAGRTQTGRRLFGQANLPLPTIWETPHYFGSDLDYRGIDTVYATRYERDVFFGGLLSGQPANYSHIFGQFFPYTVTDVYGEKVIPENLGDDEPTAMNNNPPRTPADIIHNAQLNLAVTQGTASFFFDPSLPLSDLQQIVGGIRGLGYTFVKATSF